jgi:hypothetical protein
MVFDRDNLTRQVLRNCRVADARHAGLHSVCGLALRLRDLYKWEKGLDPWIEEESARVLEWIGEREELWERIAERDLAPVTLGGHAYDPFDTQSINGVLEPRGLIYGAGYVQGLRPTFFLALLDEKREIEGYPVYLLGTELARDLLTLPALTQEGGVLIRKESARLFLYNQIFFMRESGRRALEAALECYGLGGGDFEALPRNLDRITEAETETFLYHELGELRERIFDRGLWREIIATYPHSPVELLARALKDLLADTGPEGLLLHLGRERKKASLAFYVAFLDGLRKELFPEIIAAFDGIVNAGDWHALDAAVLAGYGRAKDLAESMSRIYRAAKEKNDLKWGEREMERRLLVPLGIVREAPQGS